MSADAAIHSKNGRGFINHSCSRAITPRTKMILVNTPHNPVGKVFTRDELQQIADIAEEHNLLIVSDEVVCRSCLNLNSTEGPDTLLLRSMTRSCSTAKNTFASPPFLACGTGRSPSGLQAVRPTPPHVRRVQ